MFKEIARFTNFYMMLGTLGLGLLFFGFQNIVIHSIQETNVVWSEQCSPKSINNETTIVTLDCNGNEHKIFAYTIRNMLSRSNPQSLSVENVSEDFTSLWYKSNVKPLKIACTQTMESISKDKETTCIGE